MTLEEYTRIKSQFESFIDYLTKIIGSEIIESHILSYEECKSLPKGHKIYYILEKYTQPSRPFSCFILHPSIKKIRQKQLNKGDFIMIKWFMFNGDKFIQNNLTIDMVNEFCLEENA